jgi:hypothetical protein
MVVAEPSPVKVYQTPKFEAHPNGAVSVMVLTVVPAKAEVPQGNAVAFEQRSLEGGAAEMVCVFPVAEPVIVTEGVVETVTLPAAVIEAVIVPPIVAPPATSATKRYRVLDESPVSPVIVNTIEAERAKAEEETKTSVPD